MSNAPEHIKKKLPSMYHQFMQLANLDITKANRWKSARPRDYAMGGVRVNGDNTQATNVPGLFAAGECAAGLHGANRSLVEIRYFPTSHRLRQTRWRIRREKYAKENSPGKIDDAQIEAAYKEAMEPFERPAGTGSEGPYQVQYDLQNMMQANVGIVRLQNEMESALDGIQKLKARAAKVAVQGHLEYNPGWHTAIDLKHLLTVSEAITLCSIDRKESSVAVISAEDFPNKDPEGAEI